MTVFTGSNKKNLVKVSSLLLSMTCIILLNCSGPLKDAGVNLEAGFQNPPESAKPRVWWHWMNGNISKEGIRADLEWMKRIGIGGFQNFDAGLASPQVVEKRLIYMTPEWKDAFLFTTRLADSLGLEMAIAGSPGWSESGGPWVTPAQAMKKLVWSEVRIEGGKPFTGTLPRPPSTTGSFQNIPGQSRRDPSSPPQAEYYADAAVVAYKIPVNDLSLSELNPKVTSSNSKFELSTLIDGDLTNSTFLPAAKPNKTAWIQFEFSKPVTVQSLTLVSNETGVNYSGLGGSGNNRILEASDNGRQFKTVFEIPGIGNMQRTFSFAPATNRFFRITFKTPPPRERPGLSAMFSGPPPPGSLQPAGIRIAEVILHSVVHVNRFEDKAGFSAATRLYTMATSPISAADAVNKSEIIDLTLKMHPDGTLDWTPPEGRWGIIRFGYSLTGHQNSPASPEATGLEVDKLNANHVKAYFDNYLDQYKDATGGLMGKRGLQYIITDSWEAGVQNWTDSMIVEFSRHRGYDMLPWMPVLTGLIVESAEASERFLWDFRKTIADLTAENHYDQLTTILHNRGMGRYTESHEGGRAFIGDGMEVKQKADIPMSATWTPGGFDGDENAGVATRYKADVLESASVAHIYGQNLVAAESMTAIGNTWAFSPERLKPTADMELAMGLNRFVIHTSVHQPVSDKIPGLGLGPFGQWFTRHETWAELAKPWTTYLARNSFMLQRGKFVADIIYYYGEDNNITALFGEKLPDIPEGFNYDFINSDALLNSLSVENGLIVTPGGMSYRLLVLDQNSRHMPLPVLLKIRDMVEGGAVVAGPKPVDSPSLSDDQSEFQAVVSQLWKTENGENSIGMGKIYTGKTVAEVLAAMQLTPDFDYTKPEDNTSLLFVHRKLLKADIYWVNNRHNREENLEAIFRVKGKIAEVWHPETGKIEQVSYAIEGDRTRVPLRLAPNDAVFVVFYKAARKTSFNVPKTTENNLITIKGAWDVSFQPNRGAPSEITLDTLVSWSENPDTGVKYFSGTGIYTKNIQAPENWFKEGDQLWLDLGTVKNLAEVLVNGKSLGIVWKKPFRVDITDAIKPGKNTLEVKVTNLWVNRLIGDQQPDITKKYTYTTQAFYRTDSPLLPSGLLGPVQIVSLSAK
ncbi:MAG: discoidin domain-containing protein [Bacteroidales bacterium]|nr:discoidin domain-containing protein [Bacteroidales bacterium]